MADDFDHARWWATVESIYRHPDWRKLLAADLGGMRKGKRRGPLDRKHIERMAGGTAEMQPWIRRAIPELVRLRLEALEAESARLRRGDYATVPTPPKPASKAKPATVEPVRQPEPAAEPEVEILPVARLPASASRPRAEVEIVAPDQVPARLRSATESRVPEPFKEKQRLNFSEIDPYESDRRYLELHADPAAPYPDGLQWTKADTKAVSKDPEAAYKRRRDRVLKTLGCDGKSGYGHAYSLGYRAALWAEGVGSSFIWTRFDFELSPLRRERLNVFDLGYQDGVNASPQHWQIDDKTPPKALPLSPTIEAYLKVRARWASDPRAQLGNVALDLDLVPGMPKLLALEAPRPLEEPWHKVRAAIRKKRGGE